MFIDDKEETLYWIWQCSITIINLSRCSPSNSRHENISYLFTFPTLMLQNGPFLVTNLLTSYSVRVQWRQLKNSWFPDINDVVFLTPALFSTFTELLFSSIQTIINSKILIFELYMMKKRKQFVTSLNSFAQTLQQNL